MKGRVGVFVWICCKCFEQKVLPVPSGNINNSVKNLN